LKLVIRELKSGRGKNKPIIINFNPWWFSGQDQLLHAFLDQLSSALGRVDSGKRVTELGSKLNSFGKLLRPFSWIPGASSVGNVADLLQAGGEAAQNAGNQPTPGRSETAYCHRDG
jgi:predicted KAP-like P-loop ATPase